jgi:hypothetical protein
LAQAPESSAERALSVAFITAKRESEATSEFVRVLSEDGGRFGLSGRGDVNTYALFGELFASLSRTRAGIIAPTGIATDITTAPFFADLVSHKRLAQLVDFENRNAIFPSVHRSFKFCILTLGRNEAEASFSFFLTDPAQLADPERKFNLSPETIERLNPNTLTAPVFRSRVDAALTSHVYSRVQVLIDDGKGADGNPWGISFARLFDMSNDSQQSGALGAALSLRQVVARARHITCRSTRLSLLGISTIEHPRIRLGAMTAATGFYLRPRMRIMQTPSLR